LYVERKTSIGKLFPVTNEARTITRMMLDEIERADIEIFYQTEVQDIYPTSTGFKILCNKIDKSNKVLDTQKFFCKKMILSAGGKTYPAFGSDGSGYGLAKSMGHQIIKPIPSALSLVGKNHLSQKLQGQKMEMKVTSIIEGEEIKTTKDDVMFKKYGLSGPAILNVSREISIHFNRENKNDCYVRLNFFPEKDVEEVDKFMRERWKKRPEQSIEHSLFGIFPTKIPKALLASIDIKKDKLVSELSEEEKKKIINTLSDTKIRITGTRGWNEAEFTAGGIDTYQVKPVTLESKLVSSLYLAGEILNVDGDVGGFNLSWSWASGYVAGKLR
jgi:hypothetical protein